MHVLIDVLFMVKPKFCPRSWWCCCHAYAVFLFFDAFV